MACLMTQGRLEPCKEFVGGLYKVWFANFGTLVPVISAADVITNLSGTTSIYEYQLKGSSKLIQEIVSSRENGTTIVNQTLTLDLKGGDYATNNEIKLLAYGRPQVIVQDNFGNAWLAGRLRGVELTTGSHDTGAAYGDKYGYTLTLFGTERTFANFFSGSTITDAFAGMTQKPTIVTGT